MISERRIHTSSLPYWEENAEKYHAHLDAGNDPFQDKVNGPALVSMSGSITGHVRTVVDIGCGNGRFSRILGLAFPEASVIGIDGSVTLLRHARQDGISREEYVAGDIVQPVGLRSRCADVCVSKMVLPSIPDCSPVIADMSRIIRPGGHILISTLHQRYYGEYLKPKFDTWLYSFYGIMKKEMQTTDDSYEIIHIRDLIRFVEDEMERNPLAVWTRIAGSEFSIPVYPHGHDVVTMVMQKNGCRLIASQEVSVTQEFTTAYPQWLDRTGLPVAWNTLWKKGA